jgi:hypothetical protein
VICVYIVCIYEYVFVQVLYYTRSAAWCSYNFELCCYSCASCYGSVWNEFIVCVYIYIICIYIYIYSRRRNRLVHKHFKYILYGCVIYTLFCLNKKNTGDHRNSEILKCYPNLFHINHRARICRNKISKSDSLIYITYNMFNIFLNDPEDRLYYYNN